MFRKGFLRTHSSMLMYLFRFLDIFLLCGSGIFTFSISGHPVLVKGTAVSVILIALLGFIVIAGKFDLYRPWRGRNLSSELSLVAVVMMLISIGLFAIGPIIIPEQSNSYYYVWVAKWGAVGFLAHSIFRMLVRSLLKTIRSHGWNIRRVLLAGGNQNALNVLDAIEAHTEYGLSVIGYVDDRRIPRMSELGRLKYLGSIDEIERIVKDYDVNQVWINYPMRAENRAKDVLDALKFSTISTRYILDLGICKETDKSLTIMMSGLPLLDLDVSPMDGSINQLVKDIEDKVVAAIALMLFGPLFFVLAIGVKISSPGPIFYRQTRISWNNKPFEMLKFRSMPVDVEKESGPTWASAGEKRATKFGAFIRKTSLDELPQFINVLKGEMSIVGPRPERPEFVEKFKNEIPDYMKKHMVKAGITGWAQVNGYRGNTDLAKRIEHDLYYIKHWTPLFDLQIAIQTFYKGFLSKHAY